MQTVHATRAQTGQYRGRAIGAAIFTGFGVLWLMLGLYVHQQLDAASAAWITGAALFLWSACAHVLRRTERTAACPDDIRRSRVFRLINVSQWIAIFVALDVLRRMHLDVYDVTAIAVIVGLHLFPLARLFRNPLHYVTGALLVAWPAGVVWISRVSLGHADSLQSTTALGAGVILWLSAALTLATAANALRTARTVSGQPRIA